MRSVTYIRWATGTVATLLCLQYGYAQTAPRSDEDDLASIYGDKSTISLVTGNRQPLRRAPAVATVITAQDIAAMGATDLDEVLETVPGIHVGRNNAGYNPLYVIRGIYSEFNGQTLVLQNGVPMTSMFVHWQPRQHLGRTTRCQHRPHRNHPRSGLGTLWRRRLCRCDQHRHQSGC